MATSPDAGGAPADYRLHVDGQWRDGAAGRWFDAINPYTGRQLGLPGRPEPADVADAIAIALCALRRRGGRSE